MRNIERERRKYARYDTELEVYFRVKYDIETKVKFRVLESSRKVRDTHKHSGISRNVSPAGLCFGSHTKLKKGDILLLEVYPPNAKRPVRMEGEVRWSKKAPKGAGKRDVYTPRPKTAPLQGADRLWPLEYSALGTPGFSPGGLHYTGVLLMLVNGKSVADSIYFDEQYKVVWSAVLDSLFSNFKSVEKSLKKKIIK